MSPTEGAWIEFQRGGRCESLHGVSIAVTDSGGGLVARAGDAHLRTYWRSAAKPFQLLPFVASGGASAFGLDDRGLALMAASHAGERAHRDLAAEILTSAGLSEADLLCGTHPPDNEGVWRDLALSGTRPTALWNNCSGKHAGMLAHCRFRGWPTFDYRRPDHPLQREILEVVAGATGERSETIGIGIDGCGVPAFHLSLTGMATAYARLAAGDELPDERGKAARRIVEAIAAEPWFLGGTERLCTLLVAQAGERVIAKVGAVGVYCATLREQRWGLALKVADGSSQAAGVALLEALRQLHVLDPADLKELRAHAAGERLNHAGTVVGEIVPRFQLET